MTDRVVKVSVVADVNSYLAGIDKVTKATEKTRTDAQKLEQQLAQQKKAFTAAGVAMIAAGGLVAAGLAVATKKAADFDAQMAQVKTLSGATASEMNSLRDAALHLGQGIGQSATDVADAETELVKAGISVKEQLGGALKGTLDLAAAGQMNVADATTIAASAMTQFKLAGKDVPHIADLLAAGADKALGSVSDLGQGLKYVGPVAESMGISIEQTVGALSLFAQNGILGEQAGTGLRGVLLSLTSPSRLAAQTLDKYGVSLYDAQGKFIGLSGVAEQLKKHLGGLDQATRNQALGQIFGNQQITEATILMQGGAKEVDKWTNAVNDSGFAAKQASGKMDSLKGDIAKLTAAWDSAMISIGESGQGPLRGITQGVTGVLNEFNKLSEPAKQAVFWVGAVGSAVAIASGLALIAVPKIAALKVAMVELGIESERASALIGLVGKSAVLLAGVGTGVAVGIEGLDLLSQALDKVGLSAEQMQKRIQHAPDSVTALAAALSKQTGSASGFTLAEKQIESLGKTLDEFSKGKQGTIFGASSLEAVRRMGQELGTLASTDLPAAQTQFLKLVDAGHLTEKQQIALLNVMGDYKNALIDANPELARASRGHDLLNKALGEGQTSQASAGDSAVAAAEAYQAEADRVNGVTKALADMIDAMNAENDASQKAVSTNAKWIEGLADLKQQVKDHGNSLKQDTADGAANADMLASLAKSAQDAAEAQYEVDQKTLSAKDAADKYAKTLEDQRQKFIDSANAAGFNKDQVKALADQVFQVPDKKSITFLVQKDQAERDIADFTKSRTVKIFASFDTSNVGPLANSYGFPVKRANGGILPGAPSSTDNMLAHVASGEFIVKASQVTVPENRRALEYINNGGVMRGYANGGYVQPQYAQPVYHAPVMAPVGKNISVTVPVYPTQGMSELQVGRVAAEKIDFALRGN